MIVDTSAMLCVLLDEPGSASLLDAILDAPAARISAANWLELAMVVEERGGRLASLRLDEFVRTAGIEVAPVTVEQAAAARNAWRYFGRHKHSARLDFGDCFAYALAKTSGEKLLYAGEEFDRTDVEPALPAHRADMSDTPGREMSGAPGREMSGAPGREMSGAPGREMSGAPGREMSGAPGRDAPAPKAH